MSRYGYHYRATSDVQDGPRDVMDSPWVLGVLAFASIAVFVMAVMGVLA